MFLGVVFRERLDEEVEPEPEAPTVVIKGDGKKQRHHKQKHEDVLVIRADNQQEKEADDEDHEFRRDDVREDRAHEKPILTLEERHAAWTVMSDVERLRDDPGRATSGTTQLQTPPQHPLDLFKIYFQGCAYLTRKRDFSRKGAKAQRYVRVLEFLFAPLRLCGRKNQPIQLVD